MSAEAEVPKGTPLRDAWEAYKASSEYSNSWQWAEHSKHRDGSMWAAFEHGWRMATDRAAALHESVNPASDDERASSTPGAGAMGAVIEYRDAIRIEADTTKV